LPAQPAQTPHLDDILCQEQSDAFAASRDIDLGNKDHFRAIDRAIHENRVENPPSRFRSVIKQIWINLSVFVLIMIFLELGAYLYYTAKSAIARLGDPIGEQIRAIPDDAYADRSWLRAGLHEPLRELQWEPYIYWKRPPFAGRYVNIDADGRRRTWNLRANQPVEIYMFGGSTMWGIGSRDDYTIPSALSRMLTQVFPGRIRVTNYGTTGFVSTQEMILLMRELQRGCRPRIVIFYDGYNDTFSAFQNRKAGIPLNEQNRATEFNILQSSRTRDLFLAALKRSNLYNLVRDTHDKLSGPKQPPSLPAKMENKLAPDIFYYYTMNSDIIDAIGDKMRFSSLFYWQPTPYTRTNRNQFEESWLTDRAQEKFFSEVYTSVKHSPLQTRTSFHDISDVFRGYDGTLYVDFAHTTERGNEIIARRMFQDVAPLIEQEIADRNGSSQSGNPAPAIEEERCRGTGSSGLQ
jgi:lysophospholipase L1-like esterase